MDRITNKHLDLQIKILNAHFGIDEWDYSTAGHFYVQGAYGGYRLERVCANGSGASDISYRGTKREIYDQLRVLNEGLRLFKELNLS